MSGRGALRPRGGACGRPRRRRRRRGSRRGAAPPRSACSRREPADERRALGVEVSGRLVGEDNRGAGRERARDGDPLALTGGELGGPVARAVRGGPTRSRCASAAARVSPAANRTLSAAVEVGHEVEELEDEADLRAAQGGALGRGKRPERAADELDLARARPLHATERQEQRGLAGAGRAAETDELARAHGEVDAPEHRHGARATPRTSGRAPRAAITRPPPGCARGRG